MDKFEYINSCKDCGDIQFAKEHVEVNGFENWKGIIEVKEKQENFILANVNCRGSEFIIALSRYFHMASPFYSEEWCVCVPNWEFGGKVAFLEKISVYEMVHKHIPNVVDSISCTNAIMVLMEDVIKAYHEETKRLLEMR